MKEVVIEVQLRGTFPVEQVTDGWTADELQSLVDESHPDHSVAIEEATATAASLLKTYADEDEVLEFKVQEVGG